MSTLAIIITAGVVLVVLLAIGGMVANARWRRAREAQMGVSLQEVNRQLAAAHAKDKGWDRGALSEAARRAFTAERPGEEIRDQALVAVLDLPGTDEDKAVFRFATATGTFDLKLGRHGDEWVGEGIERAA